jgi:hypothetical protein
MALWCSSGASLIVMLLQGSGQVMSEEFFHVQRDRWLL